VPKAQSDRAGRAGVAAHDTLVVFTVAVPLHSLPLHEPEAVAAIFTVRTALSALTH
jgi:hypothetical protein